MDISSLSPSIREDLLLRNITSDTVEDNGLSGLLFNIGEFASIVNGTQNVRPSDNLEEIGDLYRDLLIINNRFQGELNDYQRISIVTNATEVSDGQPYNTSPEPANSPIIQNNELNKEFNALKNKYQGLLQNNTTISLVTYQPTEETFVNYDYSLADLGSSDESKGYRKNITTKNLYLDVESQILADIITTPIVTNKNLPNYAERMAGIVGGGASKNASTVIDNLLGGIVPNYSVSGTDPLFDVTSLLSGGRRTDTPETPLGIIAGDRLGFAIRQNAAFNLIEETIGNVNTNPISLLQGDSFIVPNYSITVAKGGGGAVLDFAERILGFQTPVSLLSTTSSIFSSENPVGNIERGNSMIENTGKGQVEALFFNLRQNLLSSNDMKSGYAPGFVDPRNPNGGIQGNANIYAFFIGGSVIDIENGPENNPISQSNYQLENMVRTSGFESLSNKSITVDDGDGGSETIPFTWGLTSERFDKKTMLGKTQQLFNAGAGIDPIQNKKMKTMVNDRFRVQEKTEVNSAVVNNNGLSYASRGSNKIKYNGLNQETDPETMFFRTFNSSRRYDRVNRLQKHSGLLGDAGTNQRRNTDKSVLDNNGFVKIAPYSDDPSVFTSNDIAFIEQIETKKYMFSIENLAWAGYEQNLIPEEIGNGDPTTGKRGRIMWFPPYDMAFTDNTSVNWEKTDFIGRGEPIYTYNNTTRTGTLQFKIIIDHPSYLNSLKGESDELISSFFAGGFEVDKRVRSRLSANELQAIEIANNQAIDQVNNTPTPKPDDFKIFFLYDSPYIMLVTELNSGYEDGLDSSGNTINYSNSPDGVPNGIGYYNTVNGIPVFDRTNYGLNSQLTYDFLNDIQDKLKNECPACKIKLTVYGNPLESDNVLKTRLLSVYDYFNDNILDPNDRVKNKRLVSGGVGGRSGPTLDDPFALANTTYKSFKENRYVQVEFQYSAELAEELNLDKKKPAEIEDIFNRDITSNIKSRFYSEALYFKKLEQDDKFVYNSISQKISHFHPAFHSITPEGFNSRLTFLQQCTRQGPTGFFKDDNGNAITNLNNVSNSTRNCSPDNLAFGRPPVCILRVGDFYHTKIVIDSLNFSFDPLVWDLNPEGVGVQPMICTVDINFAFIGGSSLSGPINRLQNAVTYNFFANTEVYSPQSDTIVKKDDKFNINRGKYPTTLVDPIDEDPVDIEGLDTNNTIVPDTDQEAVAEEASGPQAPPVAPVVNEDVNTLKSSTFVIPGWVDGKMQLKFKDIVLDDDWSATYSLSNNNQKVKMETFPKVKELVDDDFNLILLTKLTKNDMTSVAQQTKWSRSDTVEIPYLVIFVDFFKTGMPTVSRSLLIYLAACDDDDNDRYDFIYEEYQAGYIACECQNGGNCPY
jgi:hypothetical protein